jgi:hypothetical protein
VSHIRKLKLELEVVRGEESKQAIESPLSLSEAYRLAKHMEGDLGAARLGKALREDGQGQVAAVLEAVRECYNDKGDLGEALCEFWFKDEWSWR